MEPTEIESSKIIKGGTLFGGIVIMLIFASCMSWTDVNPGEEGFIYRPYRWWN